MKRITLIAAIIFTYLFVNAQDIIYKTDGTEIKAKIIELTTETINPTCNFFPKNPPFSMTFPS